VTESEWIDREASRLHESEYGADAVAWDALTEDERVSWRAEARRIAESLP
jgi:hypothetical protein